MRCACHRRPCVTHHTLRRRMRLESVSTNSERRHPMIRPFLQSAALAASLAIGAISNAQPPIAGTRGADPATSGLVGPGTVSTPIVKGKLHLRDALRICLDTMIDERSWKLSGRNAGVLSPSAAGRINRAVYRAVELRLVGNDVTAGTIHLPWKMSRQEAHYIPACTPEEIGARIVQRVDLNAGMSGYRASIRVSQDDNFIEIAVDRPIVFSRPCGPRSATSGSFCDRGGPGFYDAADDLALILRLLLDRDLLGD